MIIKKIHVVKYTVKVITGIHIGGSKENYGIGGVDSPVIKNPLTNEPIIPGSSIKGKIRMLLETVEESLNKYKDKDKSKTVSEAFGFDMKENVPENNITRILFRDLSLTEESKAELQKRLGKGFFTEVKAENKIDRSKGTAESPRFIERVPAGAIFEGECVIQELDGDEEGLYKEMLEYGFRLLENSALGASGSRGYGKVEIKTIKDGALD